MGFCKDALVQCYRNRCVWDALAVHSCALMAYSAASTSMSRCTAVTVTPCELPSSKYMITSATECWCGAPTGQGPSLLYCYFHIPCALVHTIVPLYFYKSVNRCSSSSMCRACTSTCLRFTINADQFMLL